MKELPIIFIFDLDNTLIGDGTSVAYYIEFLDFIKIALKTKKINTNTNTKVKLPSSSQLISRIQNEYYRPGLVTMLNKIKELFPTAEFFIYSAGSKSYVEYNIKCIEQTFNIHFNRPIFTRDDCVYDEKNYTKKSIISIYPRIFKALITKYPQLNDAKIQSEIISNRNIIIDNNDVIWDDKNKWIQCPDYNYKYIIDFTQYIPKEVLTHPLIIEYMKNNKLSFVDSPNLTTSERELMYHTFMANQNSLTLATNLESSKDDFFQRFTKTLKTLKINKLN